MKICYIASRSSHIKNFHMEYINRFKADGDTIMVITQGVIDDVKTFDLQFNKHFFGILNISTIIKVRKIFKDETFDLVIANATLACLIARIARCNVLRMVCISHGYLFTKFNILHILIEKMLAKKTDLLLTMNNSDFNTAKNFRLGKKIYNINGMGLPRVIAANPIQYYKPTIVCVGEMSKRKNQSQLIMAFKALVKSNLDVRLILVGDGDELYTYKKMALGYDIEFVGYKKNAVDYIVNATIVVSTSKVEGIPFNIMEALHFHKVVVASNIKGHIELIKDANLLFNTTDELIAILKLLLTNKDYYNSINLSLNDKFYLDNTIEEFISKIRRIM